MIYTFDSATSGKSDDVTVYVDGRKMPLSGIGGPGQGSGNANPFQGVCTRTCRRADAHGHANASANARAHVHIHIHMHLIG